MLYDLHTHSTASDGTLSPSELVRYAVSKGVDVLALTDHDTTNGLKEARDMAKQAGITLINGAEISVSWGNTTVHILGLGIDPASNPLQKGLTDLCEFRQWRAEEIARKLEKAGVPDAMNGARKYARGGLISRTHFARYLVECGKARDIAEVFKKYLVSGRPGHVAGQWASLETVVSWIMEAGGEAVIAHPARYKMSATKLRRLIEEFKAVGGVGLEVGLCNQSANQLRDMAQYARRYSMLASQGSDYHGPENPWIDLGKLQALPSGCEPIWAHWS